MQFIDLKSQYALLRGTIDARIQRVLDHGQYILGPEVAELENRLAEFVGTRHCVGCASGTDALMMALMAKGVGPGDAVFVPPFTFFATAEVVALLGATPVFVDIDPVTFNLDPCRLTQAIEAVRSVDRRIHPLPRSDVGDPPALQARGVIAVNLFGQPADYDRISGIASSHGLFVIEDAAQSFGAHYGGSRACSLGDVGCTSFFPAKPLGCYGDGGALFTDSSELAEAFRSIRVHGMGLDRYQNVRLGITGRLDTLQAAILLAKLEAFPAEIRARQHIGNAYTKTIESRKLPLVAPTVMKDRSSVWAQYSVLARDNPHRQACLDRLKAAGIPTAIYYPRPLHLQEAFAGLGYRQHDFPVSEDCSRRIFSVPMHPYLDDATIESIVDVLAEEL